MKIYLIKYIKLIVFIYMTFPVQINAQNKNIDMKPNFNDLKSWLDSRYQNANKPGIQYSVSLNGKIAFEYNAGSSDVKTGNQITKESLFMANSTTKVITVIAIQQLIDNGILNHDDKLINIIPGLAFDSRITVSHLLSHTSGLENPMPLKWFHLFNNKQFNKKKWMARIIKDNSGMNQTPGQEYDYNNLGYLLLGQIIEKKSKMSWCKYVQKNILERLNINENEMSCHPTNDVFITTGHQKKWSLFSSILYFLSDSNWFRSSHAGFSRLKKLKHNGDSYGGLFSNTTSWQKILSDITSKHSVLLSPRLQTKLFAKFQKDTANKYGWSQNKLLNNKSFSKPGGGPGFFSNIRIYKTQKNTMITVFQVNQTEVRESEILKFSNLLDSKIKWN